MNGSRLSNRHYKNVHESRAMEYVGRRSDEQLPILHLSQNLQLCSIRVNSAVRRHYLTRPIKIRIYALSQLTDGCMSMVSVNAGGSSMSLMSLLLLR